MVEWTASAKNDLKGIHSFIAKDTRFYAQKVIRNIIEKSEILEDFPKMGKVVTELGNSSIREISIYSYRMIYEITLSGIFILALVHKRQNFPTHIE